MSRRIGMGVKAASKDGDFKKEATKLRKENGELREEMALLKKENEELKKASGSK